MPYQIRPRGTKFELVNVATGHGFGKTTKGKAERQKRLLLAIEHGYDPSKRK